MKPDEIVEETHRMRKEYASQFEMLLHCVVTCKKKKQKANINWFLFHHENQLHFRRANALKPLLQRKMASTKLENEEKFYTEPA
jgi:hypothetical protein